MGDIDRKMVKYIDNPTESKSTWPTIWCLSKAQDSCWKR